MISVQEKLQGLLGVEQFVLLVFFCFIDYIVFRAFLSRLNPDRQASLRNQFRELLLTLMVFTAAWGFQYLVLKYYTDLQAYYHYFGVTALLTGALLFVRATRIMVSQYLFLNSVHMGVPILLVNIFTLTISIFIGAWISTSIFGVRWAPLLATSAILSVVLGLALQDTLGNLFAGVSLQFDKSYEIGDWIEVHTPTRMVAGEVHEITWRATTLWGFFDEVITLPNRMMAQSEVSNYSGRRRPIYRAISLYLDVDGKTETIKQTFAKILKETPGVLQNLEHFIMLREINEKGVHWRLSYPIAHYSRQYIIIDDLLVRIHRELGDLGIEPARIRVETFDSSKSKPSPGARA